jgi:hypothetical protein
MKKNNLNKAFRELRKSGFFAKQNFECCNTCGWASVPGEEKNVVFYHYQAYERLRNTGITYLSWCGNAEQIISIFEANDIKTDWDGSKNTKIQIDIN